MKPQDRTNALFDAPWKDPQAKLLLIAIARRLKDDDDSWCWPGLDALVDETGISERTVQNILAWASAPEVGAIVVRRSPGKPVAYQIDWSQVASCELPPRTSGARQGGTTPAAAAPPQRRHPAAAAQTPAAAAENPRSGGAQGTDHEPINEPERGREDRERTQAPRTEPTDPGLAAMAEVLGTRADLMRLLVAPMDPKDPPIRDLDTLRRTPLTADEGPDLVHRGGMGPQRARQLAALLEAAGVPLIAERQRSQPTGPPARAAPAAERRQATLDAIRQARERLESGVSDALP